MQQTEKIPVYIPPEYTATVHQVIGRLKQGQEIYFQEDMDRQLQASYTKLEAVGSPLPGTAYDPAWSYTPVAIELDRIDKARKFLGEAITADEAEDGNSGTDKQILFAASWLELIAGNIRQFIDSEYCSDRKPAEAKVRDWQSLIVDLLCSYRYIQALASEAEYFLASDADNLKIKLLLDLVGNRARCDADTLKQLLIGEINDEQ